MRKFGNLLTKVYRNVVNNHIKNTKFYRWLDALINLIQWLLNKCRLFTQPFSIAPSC